MVAQTGFGLHTDCWVSRWRLELSEQESVRFHHYNFSQAAVDPIDLPQNLAYALGEWVWDVKAGYRGYWRPGWALAASRLYTEPGGRVVQVPGGEVLHIPEGWRVDPRTEPGSLVVAHPDQQ